MIAVTRLCQGLRRLSRRFRLTPSLEGRWNDSSPCPDSAPSSSSWRRLAAWEELAAGPVFDFGHPLRLFHLFNVEQSAEHFRRPERGKAAAGFAFDVRSVRAEVEEANRVAIAYPHF